MKKKNKAYIIFAVVAIIVLLVMVNMIMIKSNSSARVNTSGENSAVKEMIENVKLPDKSDLAPSRLENVEQADTIGDSRQLYDWEAKDGSVIYKYYDKSDTPGQSFTVTAKAVNIAEYELTLPVGDKVEKVNYDKYELTFYDRKIFYTADQNSPIPPVIQNNIENGHAEIRYNGSIPELVSAQSVYWYDKDNGIAYNMEALSTEFTKDEMIAFAEDYIKNGRKQVE